MKAYSLRLTAAAAVVVIVLLAGCGRSSNRMRGGFGGPASPAPIPTAIARQASVHPTLVIAGIIAPLQNVAISSTLSEPADAVNVNEGDQVRAGEVIAVFDTADLASADTSRNCETANLRRRKDRASAVYRAAQLRAKPAASPASATSAHASATHAYARHLDAAARRAARLARLSATANVRSAAHDRFE